MGTSSRFLGHAVALLDASGRAGEPVVIVMVVVAFMVVVVIVMAVVVVVVTGRAGRWDFLAQVLVSGLAGSLPEPANTFTQAGRPPLPRAGLLARVTRRHR